MKWNRSFFRAVLPATFLAIALLPAGMARRAFADDDKDTPLATEMKGMNKDFKQLKKQITDPAQKDSSLALIASIEKHAKAARELSPANASKIPAADRAKWTADYRKHIDDLISIYDKVQAAIAGGHLDEGKGLLDQILSAKREGHKEFAKDEK